MIFLFIISILINNTLYCESEYKPSEKELLAYNTCSYYVNSKDTLFENTYKKEKKMYHDFLKDFNNGECGDITLIKKQNINGLIKVVDPYNHIKVYEGTTIITPNYLKTSSKYELSLSKIKIKVDYITNFLLKDYQYTKYSELENILEKLKKYDLRHKSTKIINSDFKKISNKLIINSKFTKSYMTSL